MTVLGFLDTSDSTSKPSFISFNDLSTCDHDKKTIQIRGFAYKKTDGQWILSPDPALKSCCVGAALKAKEQIFLSGNFAPLSEAQAIVVQGNLHTHTTRNVVHYFLDDAQIVSEGSFPWSTLCLVFGAALLFGGYSYFFKRKQKK